MSLSLSLFALLFLFGDFSKLFPLLLSFIVSVLFLIWIFLSSSSNNFSLDPFSPLFSSFLLVSLKFELASSFLKFLLLWIEVNWNCFFVFDLASFLLAELTLLKTFWNWLIKSFIFLLSPLSFLSFEFFCLLDFLFLFLSLLKINLTIIILLTLEESRISLHLSYFT